MKYAKKQPDIYLSSYLCEVVINLQREERNENEKKQNEPILVFDDIKGNATWTLRAQHNKRGHVFDSTIGEIETEF